MGIKILLVDDHKIMRDGLRALLAREPDLEIIAEADGGLAAIRLVRERKPDVVVMDLNMPEMGGIEATRRIMGEFPEVRVLALTMESDQPVVVEVLKAGAKGYLLKDCAAEELVQAIRTVAAGDPYLGPHITALILKDYIGGGAEAAVKCQSVLTGREQEVLQLVADGKSTKEIAFALGSSIKTVETQRLNIMKKLDLYSIAELTKYAIRHGLTSIR